MEDPRTRTGALCCRPLPREREYSPFVGEEQAWGSNWVDSTPGDPTSLELLIFSVFFLKRLFILFLNDILLIVLLQLS